MSLAPPPPAVRPGSALRAFLRSFAFAWTGLTEAAVRDRNLRIHLGLGVLAGAFAAVAPLAPGERAVLLVCVAAVIAAEAANTAFEAIVDLVSPEWSERARVAKDAAAAAVLVLAAGSALALAAIALERWDELLAEWPDLRATALYGGLAAYAVAVLPWRAPRPSVTVDVLFGAVAALGVAVVAWQAESHAGTAAAALCAAVSISAAWRKRRLRDRA